MGLVIFVALVVCSGGIGNNNEKKENSDGKNII